MPPLLTDEGVKALLRKRPVAAGSIGFVHEFAGGLSQLRKTADALTSRGATAV